jgi:urease accessory protein
MNLAAQMRLFQMASQAFPIGGYCHSHGLEAAVESGIVVDADSALRWILDVLTFAVNSYEIPCLARFGAAWAAADDAHVRALNEEFLATRETAELRSATVQMGFSMRALVDSFTDLPPSLRATLNRIDDPSLPCVWSGVAAAWGLAPSDSAAAYLWSWAENQVLVAIKALPLGQSAGQRLLQRLGADIAQLAATGEQRGDEPLSNFAPALAILSAQHETQYSRLFRS